VYCGKDWREGGRRRGGAAMNGWTKKAKSTFSLFASRSLLDHSKISCRGGAWRRQELANFRRCLEICAPLSCAHLTRTATHLTRTPQTKMSSDDATRKGGSATTKRPMHVHTNAPQIGGGHIKMAEKAKAKKAAAAAAGGGARALWDVTGNAPKWAPPTAISSGGKRTVAPHSVALALECARGTVRARETWGWGGEGGQNAISFTIFSPTPNESDDTNVR
jgi:hypothetical protein